MHRRIFTIHAEKADKEIEDFMVSKYQKGYQSFFKDGMLWMYEDLSFGTGGISMICIRFDFSNHSNNEYIIEFIIGGGKDNYMDLIDFFKKEQRSVNLFSKLLQQFCDTKAYAVTMGPIVKVST